MHWNAEGVNSKRDGYSKKLELENILNEEQVSICCLQETHLNQDIAFKIRGYQCFRSDRKDRRKGGILTLVRNNIIAVQLGTYMEGAEYQMLQLRTESTDFHLLNYYCPNDRLLALETIPKKERVIICGDFNSHSQSWGYDHMDKRGEELENWQDENGFILINQPCDPPTFYSRSWHTTSTPDLSFHSSGLEWSITRTVGKQLGGSDHRPVFLTVANATIKESSTLPRWNYKKADWTMYQHRTSLLTKDISTDKDINKVVEDFSKSILQAAHETIPRGARKEYKPYWSNELEKLHNDVETARKQAESSPSQMHHNNYQQAKAKFQRAKMLARRTSWKEKTEALNFEKDTRKLWKLAKQLNDEDTGRNPRIAICKDGNILTGKQAADYFAESFANDNNIIISPEKQREICEKRQTTGSDVNIHEIMEKPITSRELEVAISKLKMRKSPGIDGVSNEMIKHLGSPAKTKLLQIFNICWTSGKVPQTWREAIMIPLKKPGKDSTTASSYRPISLTSCLCKTMERIINLRLQWYLESEKLLAPQQAGFRQCYSTEDQATYLSQEIEDAFQDKKVVLTAWIDLKKAFDKVWKEGLLKKLRNNSVNGRMYQWIKAYLHNRRARVQLDGRKSKKILLRHGVPQGGVLSPTLFLVYINDLVAELPHGTKVAMYADDLVIWCSDEYATVATKLLQRALDALTSWANRWCVSINTDKCSTTLFTLSPKQKASIMKINGELLREDKQPTYLGVTFDDRLTWKPHINKAATKARRKLAILRKLSGTTWGANGKILNKIYQQSIRPHLEYGSAAWCPASKTTLQELDKVQNQALRVLTGAMKSTPIVEMENMGRTQALRERRDTKVLIQAEKFKCMPNHPMKSRFQNLAMGRLKRSSFIHQAKRISRQHSDLPEVDIPLNSVPEQTPWREEPGLPVHIQVEIKGIIDKEEQNSIQRRVATLSFLDEEYPHDLWVRAYTDGSAHNAIMNGGAGVYIEYPNNNRDVIGIPTGKFCHNYDAEVQAIKVAIETLLDTNLDPLPVVFLTDAKSVLQALQTKKLPGLQTLLTELRKQRKVTMQWIPSHCGIPGNERADRLAKRGAANEQPDVPISYHQKKKMIRTIRASKRTQDDYQILNRPEQVIIMRLRTGHNRLRSHMYTKFKIGDSAICTCGQAPQTTGHILQDCPEHETLRQTYWSRETTVDTKLYGPLCELQKTVKFIQETTLQI
jgi:ribonuclease HI